MLGCLPLSPEVLHRVLLGRVLRALLLVSPLAPYGGLSVLHDNSHHHSNGISNFKGSDKYQALSKSFL